MHIPSSLYHSTIPATTSFSTARDLHPQATEIPPSLTSHSLLIHWTISSIPMVPPQIQIQKTSMHRKLYCTQLSPVNPNPHQGASLLHSQCQCPSTALLNPLEPTFLVSIATMPPVQIPKLHWHLGGHYASELPCLIASNYCCSSPRRPSCGRKLQERAKKTSCWAPILTVQSTAPEFTRV